MKLPDFKYEKKLWQQGYRVVAGADEVGRGAFAGPVVAGCVAFWQTSSIKLQIPDDIKINDSKKLRPRQREKAAKWIKKNALTWGIGQASVAQINRFGIKKASEIAFRKAVQEAQSKTKIDYLLIDAFYLPFTKGLRRKNQKAIINGDEKSVSIAAASIIAKVYRDRLMRELSRKSTRNAVIQYKVYGWGRNKGYGTREHQSAIKKYGITKLHRKAFTDSFFSRVQSDI